MQHKSLLLFADKKVIVAIVKLCCKDSGHGVASGTFFIVYHRIMENARIILETKGDKKHRAENRPVRILRN